MVTAAIVSFRLGGTDGVSIEAAKWHGPWGRSASRCARWPGTGRSTDLCPGWPSAPTSRPAATELGDALRGADLVVVENLCSLPLNPAASRVVAQCLPGPTDGPPPPRPGLAAPHLAPLPPPPDDPAWRHVTINELQPAPAGRRGIGPR